MTEINLITSTKSPIIGAPLKGYTVVRDSYSEKVICQNTETHNIVSLQGVANNLYLVTDANGTNYFCKVI